jgi:hypothetical protein
MGNSENRFADRAEVIDDFNSVHVNFIGGKDFSEMADIEECPADQLVLAHTKERDPKYIFPINPLTLRVNKVDDNYFRKAYNEINHSLNNKKKKL